VELLERRALLSASPFLPRQLYPIDITPRLLTTGVLTSSGLPDVITPLPSVNAVAVLLNKGDGTFTRAPFIPFQTPRAVATGDFNHDGNVDVAVSGTDAEGDNVVAIFNGNGNGTFSSTPVRYPVATAGIAIATADLTGDGFADLVVTTAHRIAILLNNGNGTFATAVYYNTGANNNINDQPSTVTVADFNNDGLPDIATALQNSGRIGILLNNKSAPGTFGAPTTYVVPGNPLALAAGDFNHDGNIDLAIVSSGFRIRGINVLLGNGNGTFGPAVTYNGPYFADAVATADFTGDGNNDLVIGSFDGPLEMFQGNGDGTFATPINIPGAFFVQDIQVADMNGDGAPDLVVPSGGIKVYLNSNSPVTPIPPGPPSDQTIGTGSARSFSFYASDGTLATVTLQGPGTATLHFSGSNSITIPSGPNFVQVTARQLASISITGTSLASVLSISTQFRSQILAVPTISADGPLGVINAPTTHLTGDLSLPGGVRRVILSAANMGTISIGGGAPPSLLLGQTANETISSAVPLGRITVNQDAGITLTAPSVTAIVVGGSLHDSTLTFTAPYAAGLLDLGNLNVMKGMSRVVLASAGSIGTISAQFMNDDTVSAGVGPLAPGQIFPGPTDFIATATIQTVRLQTPLLVPSFLNSFISAYRENTLNLGSIQTANGGAPFGITAHSIGTLTGADRVQGRSFVLTNLSSPAGVAAALSARKLNLQDFMIQIV
jgi:hypothetical protein